MQIVQYQTQEEAEQIIAEKTAQGLTLVEVANITEGNFLGFMENPILPSTPIEARLIEIQNTVDILLLKQEEIL